MKVFISADIEGTAGIVSQLQATNTQNQYAQACKLMTEEINAAIEGCFEAGAKEVTVCDAHANMQNIDPELLDSRAVLVRGAIRDSLQMQGIDGTYDALMVTGAHAAAGTQGGVLDHSWVGSMVYNIRINGVRMNEACLNAVTAGFYKVPLVMVSGDEATIGQTNSLFKSVVGVVVKHGYSRYCAASLHPMKAQGLIKDGAKRALSDLSKMEIYTVGDNLDMEIDFYRTDMTDAASLVPGVIRKAARTIAFSGDPLTVFKVQELVLYRLKYEM